MVVVLLAWFAVALVLGAAIGRGIHQADVLQFPEREEHARWDAVPARDAPAEPTPEASRVAA